MKKLFLLPFIYCMLIMGCQTTDSDVLDNEKKETLTVQQRSENIPLIRKVSATFNKVVQNEEAWKKIQAFVTEDHVILKSNNVFEDHFIMNAKLVIEDDIIFRAETIKDDVLPKSSLKEVFINTYSSLYPEDNINYTTILKQLPKLHFGIPVSALKNYDTWKENGFPVLAKSYDANNNKLEKVNKEEAIKLIGIDNFNKLTEKSKEPYESYYASKSDVVIAIIAIATRKKQGNIITIKDDKTSIASFVINDEKHYNELIVNDGNETFAFAQNNMMQQTYIDLPNGCNGYYSFICGSDKMNTYTQQMQKLANDTCNTIWRCIPCCDPYTGGINYYAMIFEPNSIKCKKTMDYLQVLSMYSLEVNY
ncbi:hypothetical protein SAMN04487765_2245 [Tenacibaculum sp. MAR_2010_89]|uniref:hypothetical protein n=1 Tax=Tenacibaculum sp. MAR_2010_89 TaxID=1250198 RepID=UPI00089A3A57|nr:hypothetical protein [Tenacibaculum sp. MAR_2010_89]SEE35312.1 hypothetical protein SAMN04487765_2245 [Tenacibaculum sp. MAR_2010_89]